MAEQDIREDQMTIVSSVDYVRGLKGNNSVLITISDLFSDVVRERGTIAGGTDLNSITKNGLYRYYIENGELINGPSLNRFVLLCFNAISHIAQIAINVHPNVYAIRYRTSHDNGSTWNLWKSISIT